MKQTEQIDRYKIVRELGRGGMSTVYEAHDTQNGGAVAVKLLRSGLTDDQKMRERFEREAWMLKRLRHPAVVPLLDFGEVDGRLYFVMPYMPQGSLQDRLANGPLAFDDAVEVMRRMALALDVAHVRSIIHRDLKPHNIIFDAKGRAFLADFGIARLVEPHGLSQTVTMIGTPEYMAPEQVLEAEITPKTDIYQLGVVLFQMLAGHRPFEGSVHQVMSQHLHTPPPSIEQLVRDLPIGLDAVMARALAKDPAARFKTAGELASALVLLQREPDETMRVPPLFSQTIDAAAADTNDQVVASEQLIIASPPQNKIVKTTAGTPRPNRWLGQLAASSLGVAMLSMFMLFSVDRPTVLQFIGTQAEAVPVVEQNEAAFVDALVRLDSAETSINRPTTNNTANANRSGSINIDTGSNRLSTAQREDALPPVVQHSTTIEPVAPVVAEPVNEAIEPVAPVVAEPTVEVVENTVASADTSSAATVPAPVTESVMPESTVVAETAVEAVVEDRAEAETSSAVVERAVEQVVDSAEITQSPETIAEASTTNDAPTAQAPVAEVVQPEEIAPEQQTDNNNDRNRDRDNDRDDDERANNDENQPPRRDGDNNPSSRNNDGERSNNDRPPRGG